jgi:periplasmic divalent cation tolerance protein
MSEKREEGFIEIHWTTGSLEEARKVARYLVQERLVACAQIVPWLESIYMWSNQLETTQESKIILKTRASYYDKIREVIQQNTTYQVPEILIFRIEGGNEEYFKWMEESMPADFRSQIVEK